VAGEFENTAIALLVIGILRIMQTVASQYLEFIE
jgi:hypothetical protein